MCRLSSYSDVVVRTPAGGEHALGSTAALVAVMVTADRRPRQSSGSSPSIALPRLSPRIHLRDLVTNRKS